MSESPIVMKVKVFLSSSSALATFVVGIWYDDPCLVPTAVPLVPPLFQNPEEIDLPSLLLASSILQLCGHNICSLGWCK